MNRKLTEKEAAGMTVNERLYVSGLLNEFDEDLVDRDEEAIRTVLEQIYLTQENIEVIIRHELK